MEEDYITTAEVNGWYELISILKNRNVPHEVTISKDCWLAYPSFEEPKCLIVFDSFESTLDIIGENFICDKKCNGLIPQESNLSAEEIADRVFEDEFESYPTDDFLKRRFEKLLHGCDISHWNIVDKNYYPIVFMEESI